LRVASTDCLMNDSTDATAVVAADAAAADIVGRRWIAVDLVIHAHFRCLSYTSLPTMYRAPTAVYRLWIFRLFSLFYVSRCRFLYAIS
jgi:hypothetical protein